MDCMELNPQNPVSLQYKQRKVNAEISRKPKGIFLPNHLQLCSLFLCLNAGQIKLKETVNVDQE